MSETREVAEDGRGRGPREGGAASDADLIPGANLTIKQHPDATPATTPDPSRLPRPWLVSYPPRVPRTYAYPQVTLTRFLEDAARDFPDLGATWRERATISYGTLLGQDNRLAAVRRLRRLRRARHGLSDVEVLGGFTLSHANLVSNAFHARLWIADSPAHSADRRRAHGGLREARRGVRVPAVSGTGSPMRPSTARASGGNREGVAGGLVTRDLAVADEDGYFALLQSRPLRRRPRGRRRERIVSAAERTEPADLAEDFREDLTEDLR